MELALYNARMLEENTAGEAAVEETKEERGAAETKEPDATGRESQAHEEVVGRHRLNSVLQVWKEVTDQSKQPSQSNHSPEVQAAVRIQRSFHKLMSSKSARKQEEATVTKVDPIPKPVVGKLSKEALADK